MDNVNEQIKEEQIKEEQIKKEQIKKEQIKKEQIKKEQIKKEQKISNKGKLILDASCPPADIAFPFDLGLLNRARLQTEKIIDKLHKGEGITVGKKPKTYRKVARKEYLKVAKK